jgi:signal transduction histidine kinase
VLATGGYGLAGMRGRVEQVGGTIDVRSAPGEGTSVRVTVPAGAS